MLSEKKAEFEYNLQNLIDSKCQELWYDDLKDVATCNVTGGKWEAEAKALLLWASNVWDLCEVYLDGLTEESELNFDEFVNSLPVYE